MLVPFNNFQEFEATYQEYWEKHAGYPCMFLRQFHFIEVYKKSSKWYKRLLGMKDLDLENSTSGWILSPVTEIECLCPMIDQVDVKIRDLSNGVVYGCRVKPQEIYYYK